MKTQLIIGCIYFLFGIYGNNPAEAGIVRFCYYTENGKCWELLSKEESLINENEFYIQKDSLGIQTNLKTTPKRLLDIRKFVKPEKEVDENILDAKAKLD